MSEARWMGRKHLKLAADVARLDDAPSIAVGLRCDKSPASESYSIAPHVDGLRSRIARAAGRVIIPLLLSTTSLGCLSTGSPQVERCQSEKKQLLSRLVDEQKRGESLTTELRTANQRLADAEKQLARVVGGAGANRLASSNDQSYSPRQPPNTFPGNSPSSPPASPLASAPNSVQLGAPRDSQFVSTPAKTAIPSGGSRMPSGMPGGAASGMAGGVGTVPISSPAPVDSRGFNALGPQNGRSESGWMPRASSSPAR